MKQRIEPATLRKVKRLRGLVVAAAAARATDLHLTRSGTGCVLEKPIGGGPVGGAARSAASEMPTTHGRITR